LKLLFAHLQPSRLRTARLLTGALAAGMALALAGPASALRVATGVYTGNGFQQAITTPGFQPAVVIVKGNAYRPAVIKTATMAGTYSKYFYSNGILGYNDGIQSLQGDGFTVGYSLSVNGIFTAYTYLAIEASPGEIAVGSYLGDGNPARTISGLGFPPAYVMVMSEASTNGTQRFAIQPGTETSLSVGYFYSNSPGITGIGSDGFDVSGDAEVNAAGVTYHYIAFGSAAVATGTYAGDGAASRVIGGLVSAPACVVVRGAKVQDLTLHRVSANGDNTAMKFVPELNVSNAIVRFLPDGFEVGADQSANKSGRDYYWLAFPGTGAETDASIALGSSRTSAAFGDPLALTVVITNESVDSLSGLAVTAPLPAGLTYAGHTATRGTYVPGSGLWTVGPLAGGESVNLNIDASVTTGGPATLRAVAAITALDQADSNPANDADSVSIDIIQREYRVTTGSYTGNAAASRAINGLGFAPDAVLITGQNGAGTVVRTGTMPAGTVKQLGTNQVLLAGAINSLDADGFTVANHATTNAGGVVYHWTAFQSEPGSMVIGSYTGNGADDRSIATVGFQPGYLIVMSSNNEESMQRFAGMGGDASAEFKAGDLKPDRIQAFEPTGFQVGKHNTVNGSGVQFHYLAWRDGAAQAKTGLYVGNGSASHPRNDIGFRPLHAIIRRQSNGEPTVQRSASVTGNTTLPFTQAPPLTGAITALTADGFDLGADPSVNEMGALYFWSAFRDSREADLALTVTQSNPIPNVGDTLTLDVRVDNLGTADANGVKVSAPVPAGMGFISATAGVGSFVASTGTWTLGTLANGSGATLSVRARVLPGTGGSTLVHGASVSALDELDPNTGNNTATAVIAVQAAELGIAVSADSAFASVGDTLRVHVGIANNGPNAASGVAATVWLPAFAAYVSHTGDGSFVSGTGAWTSGPIPALGAAELTVVAVVLPGAEGQQLVTSASLTAADQEDPQAANNAASVAVQVITPVTLGDVAASLYPAAASAGQPALALRIDVGNAAAVGVTLATTSTISFSDGVSTYSAALRNPTFVPANASDFTLSFTAAAVPAGMTPGASYDLRLALAGTTAEAWAYADTFLTTGRNAIFITGPEMVVTAGIVGDAIANPGAADVELLRLEFQSAYTAPRTLDSLVVTNTSTGPGTAGELDGLARALHLYGDADGNGVLSAPDSLLGSSLFLNGRAVFDVAGAWTVPAASVSRLILSTDVDSTRARDGDHMNAAITFESDIVFVEPTSIAGTISPLDRLDSYGTATIDGMVAMQVAFADAGVDTLASGNTDVWIATLVLPTNGYADDVLKRIEIADFSGGFAPADLAALELVRDDGDGVYTPGVDLPLGRFAFSGDRYQLSGLSEPIAAGNRFFLVAAAATTPTDGDTFQPGIPTDGVEMASGNDGPIDLPVVSPRTLVLSRVEEITVSARTLGSLTVAPGSAGAPMLWLDVRNNTAADATIDTLFLINASTGSGGVTELDGNFRGVSVYTDNGDGAPGPGDTLLAAGLRFTAGTLAISPLGPALSSGATRTLLVVCDVDSSCAADGDLLAVSVSTAAHVVTTAPAPVAGAFPITTNPARPVNGMVAHQIRAIATPDTVLVAGSTHNAVLDVRIHGNGYAADMLQTLTVQNLGTATDAHVSRFALFADGGDGVFDAGAGDDIALGDLTDIGGGRLQSGPLSFPLPGTCGQDARFYVSADVVPSPPSGASLQLSIPTLGIAVASGNDGPIDTPVTSPGVQLIPRPDELTVFPYSVGDKRVRPGATRVLNFGAGLYNGFDSPLVLNGMQLFQKGSATAAEIVRVQAWADADTNGLFDPNFDTLVATRTSTSVFYPLSGFNLPLPPKRISYLFVSYDLSLAVRDSVGVNLQINSETDLSLPNPSVLHGEFPIDSPGQDLSDGMVAAQIAALNAPSQTVPPGESDVFVLGFTVPRNGLLTDVLQRVSVGNAGTAAAGQDIVFLNLWAEGNGNTKFDRSGDRLLTTLAWNGSVWRNPTPIAESIPVGGLRCYASAFISGSAVDGRTLRAFLPVGALRVASGNDGPIDATVVNSGTQVISTDPLIASISTDRSSYSVGQLIGVTMNVRNVGGTTLTAVFPDSLAMSGSGGAIPVGGPVPATADLAPGEEAAFAWTLTAAAPGALSFCGSASDGSVASISVCADPVRIDSRVTAVTAAFEDHAPPGVNRGQRTVPAMTFQINHADTDSLAAEVRVKTIVLAVADNGGSGIAPNSVLSGVTLVSSSGTSAFFSLVDSTLSPVRLTLPQPIRIARGEDVTIDATIDVAASAVLAPFRLSVAAPEDLGITDANDGAPVAVSSSTPFPWLTSAIDVDEPATLVRVSGDAATATTANVGQQRVVIWDGTMQNASPAAAATAAVTALLIDFHDGTGTPIAPAGTVSRLAIFGGGTRLFETVVLPAAATAQFDLPSALLLPPQQLRSFVVEVDIQDLPASADLGITLRTPAAIAARDNNSGAVLAVVPDGGAAFPLVSRTISFQPAATGLAAALVSLAPETILPADAGIGIARLRLSHADAISSAIVVDSLALAFRTVDGAAFYPGNYFNRIVVVASADTLASVTTLSGVSSLVPCRFTSPIVLAPAAAESLTILVDAKGSFVPATFVVRVDREFIHAVDANDPAQSINISGAFPLQSDPASMRLPGDDIAVALLSSLPPNVAGNERALRVMDLALQNRNTPGFTAARLESLTVAVQGHSGGTIVPGAIVAAARLTEADSLVCAGTVTATGIVFTMPGGFTLQPGTTRDLSLVLDLAGSIKESKFRFAVADATSVVLSDDATGGPVTATSDSGFPLATQYAAVLSTDANGAFTNYPNPFAAGRESTRVTFFLDQPSAVTLRLFTLWGDPVTTLASGVRMSAGLHQDVTWDGRNGSGDTVNNGVYYLLLDIAPDAGTPQTLRRKVAVLR